MKRVLLSLLPLVLALMSADAFADHINLIPNDGTGGNFGFIGEMNGHPLALHGGTPVSFFGAEGYAPGSMLGGSAPLFLSSTEIWIGGVPLEFGFPFTDSTLFMSSFTLPTDGREFFSVPVNVSFSALGTNLDTGQTIQVGGGAMGQISFSLSNGLYYANSFAQVPDVPEPGTLGLVGTGLLSMLAFLRKKHGMRPRSK